MTLPRRVLKGRTVMVTRRCSLRMYLLRPSNDVRQTFRYCLAHAARKYDLRIHALIVLSNHVHIVCTDVHGRLPEFMAWLDGNVARALNARYGRGESFWAPGSYSDVTLDGDEEIIDKMAYVITNAVAAGLVARPSQWPGVRTLPHDVGAATIEAARPAFFFARPGDDEDARRPPSGPAAAIETARAKRRRMEPSREPLPAHASIDITFPPTRMSRAAFLAALTHRVHARVEEIHARRAEAGLGFLGARTILAQGLYDSPAGTRPDGTLNPRLACRDKWRMVALKQDLTAFWREYAECRQRYRAGDPTVVFPAGTYWLRVQFGVRCRSPAA